MPPPPPPAFSLSFSRHCACTLPFRTCVRAPPPLHFLSLSLAACLCTLPFEVCTCPPPPPPLLFVSFSRHFVCSLSFCFSLSLLAFSLCLSLFLSCLGGRPNFPKISLPSPLQFVNAQLCAAIICPTSSRPPPPPPLFFVQIVGKIWSLGSAVVSKNFVNVCFACYVRVCMTKTNEESKKRKKILRALKKEIDNNEYTHNGERKRTRLRESERERSS